MAKESTYERITAFTGVGSVRVVNDIDGTPATKLMDISDLAVEVGAGSAAEDVSADPYGGNVETDVQGQLDGLEDRKVNVADLEPVDLELSELGDVTITAAADGDYLKHNGSAWVDGVFATDVNALITTAITAERLNRPYRVEFHAAANQVIGTTDMPSATAFLHNSNRNITRVDLTDFTQCRLITRVTTGGATNARLWVGYHSGSFSTTISDYTTIAASGDIETAIVSTGLIVSSWANLHASAKGDVNVAVMQQSGDAAADPQLGIVAVEFR